MRNATRRMVLTLAAIGLVAGAAGRARAGVVTSFTDRSAFAAASQDLQNIDFEGLAPARGFKDYSTSDGLTLKGVNFVGHRSAGGDYLQVVDSQFYAPFYDWGSGAVLIGPPAPLGYIDINLPIGVTAVGSDIMTIIPYAQSIRISYTQADSTSGSVDVTTFNYNQRAFFGLTSDVAFTSLTVRNLTNDSYPEMDNFLFGQTVATAVPEPSTLISAGLAGVLGLGHAVRRRRAARVAA